MTYEDLENEELEQLIADLYTLKHAAGLSRGDKEVIDRAISKLEGDLNGD